MISKQQLTSLAYSLKDLIKKNPQHDKADYLDLIMAYLSGAGIQITEDFLIEDWPETITPVVLANFVRHKLSVHDLLSSFSIHINPDLHHLDSFWEVGLTIHLSVIEGSNDGHYLLIEMTSSQRSKALLLISCRTHGGIDAPLKALNILTRSFYKR